MHRGKQTPADSKARIKLPDELVRESRRASEGERVENIREEEAGVEPDPRRPCIRLAAITVRQPSPATRDTLDDPFGLRRHLEDQRRPRAPQPAGPKPRMTPPRK